MKKVIIASDSFKGSLSSIEVGTAIAEGIRSVFPQCDIQVLETADGGEGTVDALVHSLGGKKIFLDISDPLNRIITTYYGIITYRGQKTAVIEMAKASGLALLSDFERNPLYTSSYGTGQMVLDAIHKGCRRFLIGLGGSATNDGGMGMLSALGFRFLDSQHHELTADGLALSSIISIDQSQVPPQVFSAQFLVACDVDTPFCGPQGATMVFSSQKGADDMMKLRLEEGMISFAELVKRELGKDFTHLPGAGAAGGLGGAFWAFLNAQLVSGIDLVLDALEFDEKLQDSDLVITGEGCIDQQTTKGKTPQGVLKRASKHKVPVIALGGSVQSSPLDFLATFPILPAPVTLKQAMEPGYTKENLFRTSVQIMKLFKHMGK